MKRRITAMLIVMVMLLGMMPGKSWAEERVYTYQIGAINGVVDNKMMVGHTISFNIEKVLKSNQKMMEIFLLYGDPWIYTFGQSSESLDHTFVPDAEGNISWKIPNYSSLAGQKLHIIVRFGGLGEDSDVFFSEEYTICTDFSEASVSSLSDKTFNGAPITQSIEVTMGGKTLKEDKDYTVSYKNNTNAGTATVIVIGKGGYIGSITKSFQINKASNSMTAQGKTVKIKASKLKKKKQVIKPTKSLRICNAVGNLKFKLAGVNKKKFKKYFKVNAKNGNITIRKGLKKGKYKLKINITAAGNANYLAGTKSITVTVKVGKSEDKVYWTRGGSVYHTTKDCPTLSKSTHIKSGPVEKSGKKRACKVCG